MPKVKLFDEQETLRKARNLFWKKGYAATSMQDLVDHLEINRGSIYDTFGDKRNLYLLSIKNYIQEMNLIISKGVTKKDLGKEKLKYIFSFSQPSGHDDDMSSHGCLLVNGSLEMGPVDKEINEFILSDNEQFRGVIENILIEGQENGEFRKSFDPQSMANFIHNSLVGIRVGKRSKESKEYFEDVLNELLTMIER